MLHNIKILPEFFGLVVLGIKTFEVRRNDRGYRAGDQLVLEEWDGARYTGRQCSRWVAYVSSYAQQDGYVVLGLAPIPTIKEQPCRAN